MIVPLVTEMLVVLEVEMIGSGRVLVGAVRAVSEHSLEPWEAITFLQTVTTCSTFSGIMRLMRATRAAGIVGYRISPRLQNYTPYQRWLCPHAIA